MEGSIRQKQLSREVLFLNQQVSDGRFINNNTYSDGSVVFLISAFAIFWTVSIAAADVNVSSYWHNLDQLRKFMAQLPDIDDPVDLGGHETTGN